MELNFSKYSGLGNDFIFVDNRQNIFDKTNSLLIQRLCHRHEGIGADGVILVESSESADCRMRIFNSDGKEAEMCGNGLRCLYLFLKELGFSKDTLKIQTFNRHLEIASHQELVCCEMGSVENVTLNLNVGLLPLVIKGHFLNTGVPHFVVVVKDLQKVNVSILGKVLSHHPQFQPARTNVNFIQIISNQIAHIRTFERGVENETQACGTGCAAAAAFLYMQYQSLSPITVIPKLNQPLKFNFNKDSMGRTLVQMIGPAKKIYQGKILIKQLVH